uniref:Uncharacterized protein n=1 Tax=Cacopsylla melanoneura TaxID=428564 RepID=A0A8D8TNJ9_9HEMI
MTFLQRLKVQHSLSFPQHPHCAAGPLRVAQIVERPLSGICHLFGHLVPFLVHKMVDFFDFLVYGDSKLLNSIADNLLCFMNPRVQWTTTLTGRGGWSGWGRAGFSC